MLFVLCRDLEKAVEDLSELLESPIEADQIPTLRQQVTNKTVRVFFFPGLCSTSTFTKDKKLTHISTHFHLSMHLL